MSLHKLTRKLVAVKSIKHEIANSFKYKPFIDNDLRIHVREKLRHINILKLYERTKPMDMEKNRCQEEYKIIIMELCPGGDLLTYIRKKQYLQEDLAKQFFKQIICGLGYLHRKKIIHKDL